MSFRLHQEILEFYEFVKPREFEDEVRFDLIRRIQEAIEPAMPHVTIEAFGSFASGLYLPTADMDLVALSQTFTKYGHAIVGQSYTAMRKFADLLQRANLIQHGSLTIVSKAKVPIIKFVEKVTGLRVDVSFENTSGTKAIKTFHQWKNDFPAMPMIVALMKQFLSMRDLAEVQTGGIGGFSIICLVVYTINSLELKHGPEYARGHLDEVLIMVFYIFGQRFNIQTEGIDMRRIERVPKVCVVVQTPWTLLTEIACVQRQTFQAQSPPDHRS